MFDIKMNRGNVEKMMVSGDLADISADFVLLYKTIYESLLKDNKEHALAFKNNIFKAFPYAEKLAEKDVAENNVKAINLATSEGRKAFLDMLKKKAYAEAEGLNE